MIERELTANERKQIRELASSLCANCDKATGECLLLECRCPMVDKSFTGTLCNYFRDSVLPGNPALEAVLTGQTANLKTCPICGQKFHANGRQKYCDACQDKARKSKTAQRNRKYRQKT
jgi:hypothetical protein